MEQKDLKTLKIRSNIQWLLAIGFIVLNLVLFFVTRKIAFMPLVMLPVMIFSVFWFSRAFCGWACPRAAFLEKFVTVVSLNRPVPKWMQYYWVSLILLLVIVSRLTYIGLTKGLLAAGFMFCIAPTVGALLIGWYSPKAWCTICPTGTLLKTFDMLVGNFKTTKGECDSCAMCDKACSTGVKISTVPAQSSIDHPNCTQCGGCVPSCPKGSINLPEKVK